MGKVASLLEVGTGFHPELTGRENIQLNGAILGMSRADCAGGLRRSWSSARSAASSTRRSNTIPAACTCAWPLRSLPTCSPTSSPSMRFWQSATQSFQKKCIGKMGDISKQGRTVLFVSHNLGAVKMLCERSLLLDGGSLKSNRPDGRTSCASTWQPGWTLAASRSGSTETSCPARGIRSAARRPDHPGRPVQWPGPHRQARDGGDRLRQ